MSARHRAARRSAIALLLAVELVAGTAARAADDRSKEGIPRVLGSVPADRDRRVGTLANGLSYFIERAPEAHGIHLSLVVRAGDAEAQPREQQVAHVVEHVVVGNLRNVAIKGAIKERAERLGATWGNDAAAYTSLDRTVYFLRISPDRLSAFPEALDIVREWADPDNVTDEGIERERLIVMEEARRNSPAARFLLEAQMRTWFAGHPKLDYPRDPVGTLSASPQTIREFHALWYTPRHMALVVVGDIDPAAVLAAIEARFAGMPAGPAMAKPVPLAPQSLRAGHFLVAPGEGEEGLRLTFKYRAAPPGSSARVKNLAIARLAEHLFAPAFANLIESPGAAIASGGVGGSIGRTAETEMLTMQVTLRSGSARAGLVDALALVDTVRRHGFSADDIDRARRNLLAELGSDEPSLGEMAAAWETQFVEGAREPSKADLREGVGALTAAEVNRTLASWLNAAHRDIFILTADEGTGEAVTVDALPALEREAARAAPLALAPAAVLLPELEIPEPEATHRDPDEIDATLMRWTLPASGATLLFRRTKAPDVALTMRRRGGISRLVPATASRASEALSLITASGLGGLDARQLARFMSAHGLSVRPVVTQGREGLVGSSPAEEWSLLLRVARAYLRVPQCDAAAYRASRAATDSRERAPDAAAAASGEFFRRIAAATGASGTDFSPTKTLDVDPDQLCSLYRDLFGDTRDMVIVVEGDLDPRTVYAEVASALDIAGPKVAIIGEKDGNTGSGGQLERHTPEALPFETTGKTSAFRLSPAGTSAQVHLILQTRWPGDDKESKPGSDEAAAAIVGDILGARLLQRLREVEGGTYSVSGRAVVADTPNRIIISAGFACDAERADGLIAAVLDEFAKLRAEGPTAAELDAARQRVARREFSGADLAERWLRYGTIKSANISDVAARQWIARYLDPTRVDSFLLLPSVED